MRFCASVFFTLSVTLQSAVVAVAADEKPNILVFLCDDTGWGEIGFQGNKQIPTPNIDSIAKNGIRFTQGYVAATYCSPTRAGLMTGRYPTRFGHEFNSISRESGLSLNETTMADRFKSLGYATCAIGKWHLGIKPEYRPTSRGFDEFYGTLANSAFFHPSQFVDSRMSTEVQKVDDPDFYTTDAYAERAVDWIGQQTDKPWFLYVPFNAQHAPLEAPQEYLDRFGNIKKENRRTFAAMMSAMDDAVGKILDKVREMGEEENTLIFFLSDNGGPANSTTSRNGPLRGFKAQTWEGGTRVPFCAQWKGHLPAGKTYENPVIQLDILPTALAAAGANVDPAWKLDGVNLLPYLAGEESARPHETLYWRFGKQWAVRHGDWKLVGANGGNLDGELYNLADDISESKNLAADNPDKVAELKQLWDAWNAQQVPPSSPQEKPAKAKKRNRQQRAKARAAVAE
ncbi:MAG: sulfatase [Planctomycetes bacterium]|nr:sulfatase [Planctomycetota bacterium]